jgi:hypothetical protein
VERNLQSEQTKERVCVMSVIRKKMGQIKYKPFCDYYCRFNNTERAKLENIVFLVNDFNFFDITAEYTLADGKKRKGKFHLSELEIEKRVTPPLDRLKY